MDKRIGLIGIMVEDRERSAEVNLLLHQYADSIIGRMGLPQATEHVSVISIVIHDTQERISSLSGKLGQIPDVSTKTLYAKSK